MHFFMEIDDITASFDEILANLNIPEHYSDKLSSLVSLLAQRARKPSKAFDKRNEIIDALQKQVSQYEKALLDKNIIIFRQQEEMNKLRNVSKVEPANSSIKLKIKLKSHECPICLDTLSTGTRVECCQKIFHSSCIQTWIDKKAQETPHSVTCPSCRGVNHGVHYEIASQQYYS
jgi:hypothetical protein